jgi:signal peptidase II
MRRERLLRVVPWLALAALVVAVDQASKYVVTSSLRSGEFREVTGFFNLVLAYNRGAAFSFLSDAGGWQRPLFIVVAAVAVAVIATLLAKHADERLFCTGLALILGGALGNVCDRVVLGHVVDFLDFHALGWHFWAFNVADSAISVGAAVLILDGLRPSRRSQKS